MVSNPITIATFAAVFATLWVAHSVGDQIVIAAPTVSASARVADVAVTR